MVLLSETVITKCDRKQLSQIIKIYYKVRQLLLLVQAVIRKCTRFISSLNGERTVGTFYEKRLQKTNQKECRMDKAIKRKDNKLYVKWK